MTVRGRAKGVKNESEIGAILSRWYSGGESGTRENRTFHRQKGSGGAAGFRGDLKTPDNLFLHIECKKVEGWELTDILSRRGEKDPDNPRSPMNWWLQCSSDAIKRAVEDLEPERPKWLIFTRNNQPIFIMLAHSEMVRLKKTKPFQYRYFHLITGMGALTVMLLEDFLKWFTPAEVIAWCDHYRKESV